MSKFEPCIVVDSREQDPLTFANLSTVTHTLATGDYSVRGLEHLIVVERKSLSDLVACCGVERERFVRELMRLKAYPYKLLVVEANHATIEAGEWRSTLKPAHVFGSLASWTARYSLPVWLAGARAGAAAFTERFLYQSARHILTDREAATALLATAEQSELFAEAVG